MSSYSLLLDLPEEVRRKILIYTLLISSALADDHLRGIAPIIFDRPIAIIDHRFSSTTSELTFWGTSRMTDLFVINKQIYAEMVDLVYGTFALYFPPTRPGEMDLRWIKWAETGAPNLKRGVRHLQMFTPLYDYEANQGTSARLVHLNRKMSAQIDEFKLIRAAFPGLVSISLQCYFPDVWRSTPELAEQLAEQLAERVENAVGWWKAQNVRVTVFPDLCAGADGAKAVACVQEKIGQNPVPQWRL